MLKSDFAYQLPEELIAQRPVDPRPASRLLVMDREAGTLSDRHYADLPELLGAGDLLIFNDTRVIKARLLGRKETGGKVEILVERILGSTRVLAQIRASKTPRAGTVIFVGDDRLEVTGQVQGFHELQCGREISGVLDRHGHVPLPPYIRRPDGAEDEARYQTVYARHEGAVAAPTAGLHFDQSLLQALRTRGVRTAFLTLHVGAGTFQPIRVDRVAEHRMHRERYRVEENLVDEYERARAGAGRVIAVGTTVVRALESARQGDRLVAGDGETDIFIYPGKTVRAVDGLITNFHLPESTLLMLVCAFAGTEPTLAAYRHAVEKRYRFFSYGDGMLIL